MIIYKTVVEYIASRPKEVQGTLKILRAAIKKVAPKSTETIKYGIPTYVGKKNLVHFGGYTTHISLYPGSGAIKKFAKELSKYDCSKGTLRFSIDKPLPIGLIKKIVAFRVREDAMS